MPEIIPLPGAADRVALNKDAQEAASRANATPFPGPLKDAFAIAPDIKVGPYSVRPFCEIDWEFLQTLAHPLNDILMSRLGGKENDTDYMPRGQVAWELCYIFTHPIDEVEAAFKVGVDEVRKLAKKEFSKLPMAGVVMLHKAVLQQVMLASATAISYASGEDDDGSKKNVQHPA
jgi:hypothetical protein